MENRSQLLDSPTHPEGGHVTNNVSQEHDKSEETEANEQNETLNVNLTDGDESAAIFHHVEDIRDQSDYPVWSTGVSRLPSRAHSPSRLPPAHAMVQMLQSAQSEDAEISDDVPAVFNPAQIPHNLLPLAVESEGTRQIPIEQVLKAVQGPNELNVDEAEDAKPDAGSYYEHQNSAEDRASEYEKHAPILQEGHNLEIEEAQPSLDSADQTMIIHDDDDEAEEDVHEDNVVDVIQPEIELFGQAEAEDFLAGLEQPQDPATTQDQTSALNDRSDASELFPRSAPEDATIFDLQPDVGNATRPLLEAEELNLDAQGSHSQDHAFVPGSVIIPDDLDEEDFDIDNELDAEFAAMEASFNQKMQIQSPQADRDTAHSINTSKADSNAPNSSTTRSPRTQFQSPYIPVQSREPQSVQAAQTLFMPAQVSANASLAPKIHDNFNSRGFTLNQRAASATTSRSSNAASFVSGKVAYSDPYALPDVLVQKPKPRPQGQILRAAASVPNFKAPGQAHGQRYVSAATVPKTNPYEAPPPSRTQPNQTIPRRPSDSPSGFGVNSLQQMPLGRALTSLQTRLAGESYPRTQIPTQASGQSGPASAYMPAPVSEHGQQAAHQAHREAGLTSTQGLQRLTSGWPDAANTYRPEQYPSRPGPMSLAHQQKSFPPPRGPSPLREDVMHSVDAVMRGRPSPLQTDFVPAPTSTEHQRQESTTSTTSYDSQQPQDAAFREYLSQQRAAENQMFGDSFAVAEHDIYETQVVQRANLGNHQASPVGSTFPRISERPQSQPRALPIKQNISRTAYAPRSSLDEKNIRLGADMSRSSSRAGDEYYATTEPSQSPRQRHSVLGDMQTATNSRSAKRPIMASRAISSSLAYRTSDRAMSHSIAQTESGSRGHDSSIPHPVVRFGFGGKLVTSIPRTIPRFSAEGTMQHQIAGPGPVMVRTSKDLFINNAANEFPGPLLHNKTATKQKKADLQLWLAQRIPPGNAQAQDDRTILYRLLMLLLEFDGLLTSESAKQRLVQLLYPEVLASKQPDDMANFRVIAGASASLSHDRSQVISTTSLTSDSVQRLSDLLTTGDKDAALRYASDRGLWSHALIIASRISPQSWSSVVTEFAAAELQDPSDSASSLKFLYETFAGGTSQAAFSNSSSYSTDNWRKSLTMILNNRNTADDAALLSLGSTLLFRAHTYAAHFCFLLSAKPLLGSSEDPRSLLSLIGCSDLSGGWSSENEEALTMTEIYEFALSLAQPKFSGLPHLLAYKLQRAAQLCETGSVAASKRYCEAITNALKALPKASSNVNHTLLEKLRDLSQRLDQSIGEESASWMSKPKIDVLGSLQGKFSKFVAGEDDAPVPRDDHSSGPFAKLAQTPALSRVQSSAELKNKMQPFSSQYNGGYEAEGLQPNHPQSQPDQSAYPYPAGGLSGNPQNMTSTWQAGVSNLPNTQAMPVTQNRYSPAISRQGSYSAAQPIYAPQVYQQSQGQQFHAPSPMAQQPYAPQSMQSNVSQQPQFNEAVPSAVAWSQQQASGAHVQEPMQAMNHSSRPPQTSPSVEEKSLNDKYAPASPALHTEQASDKNPETQSDSAKRESASAASTEIAQDPVKEEAKNDLQEEKKTGWLGGWFGGKKKEAPVSKDAETKVHKAKLGEGMSLVYDPVTKKWTNPKGAMPDDGKAGAPPPPMAKKPAILPATASLNHGSLPPSAAQNNGAGNITAAGSTAVAAAPSPLVSKAGPPSGGIGRKLPNADDDLAAMLGNGPTPRRAASAGMSGPPGPGTGSTRAKKGKTTKRYVDVFQEEA